MDGVVVAEQSLALPPAETSPRAARDWVSDALDDWGDRERRHAVVLLVSELVTNAVVHARSTVTLQLAVEAGEVHVEVHDESPDRPTTRSQQSDRPGGRGLFLLDSLAAEWGVEPGEVGKSVWFRI